MKCRRCQKEFDFNSEHKRILSMASVGRMYNPNHLCKDCRPFQYRG